MKLTTSTPLHLFCQSLSQAARQSAVQAGCAGSYAAALGSVEFLIYSICQLHPEALTAVNEYLELHAAPPASKAALEEWFKPLDAAVNPPAGTATMTAAEHAELPALYAQLEEKNQSFRELLHQSRKIWRTQQTTSQTAAGADATGAAAAPEAASQPPAQTAPCGAPTSDALKAPSAPPAPAEGHADARSAPALPASPPPADSAAPTAPAQETPAHGTPSPASSARPNTTAAG